MLKIQTKVRHSNKATLICVNILLKTTFNVLNTGTKGWEGKKEAMHLVVSDTDILIFKERMKINITMPGTTTSLRPKITTRTQTLQRKPLISMTASRVILYAETSCMHCTGMILSSNLEGPVGVLYELTFRF